MWCLLNYMQILKCGVQIDYGLDSQQERVDDNLWLIIDLLQLTIRPNQSIHEQNVRIMDDIVLVRFISIMRFITLMLLIERLVIWNIDLQNGMV